MPCAQLPKESKSCIAKLHLDGWSPLVVEGYRMSSTIYFVWTNSCIHSDKLVSWNAALGPYKNKSLSKCGNTIIIHVYLNTCYFILWACCMKLSAIFDKKGPFWHAVTQMIFVFMPLGHIETARDLGHQAEIRNRIT